MDTLPEIIGIAGTHGSGKDTLADVRLERQNARKVSLSDILRAEADKRGLDHARENLEIISKEWGGKHGAAALAVMTLHNFKETRTPDESGLSIVSIRRPDEAKAIKDAGGLILWIDADREVRYQRIVEAHRGRVDDLVNYERFCAREDEEMYPTSDDPTALNMDGVRKMADIQIINEYETSEEYKQYLIERFGL